MSKKPKVGLSEGIQLKLQVHARSINQSAYMESMQRNTYTFGVGRAGTGKCHAKGTLIRMYDGSVKQVEDIQDGEYVMGDDSTPRLVSGTTSGIEEMYEITPIKGKPFTVNASHILCLKNTTQRSISRSRPEYVNISIKDYLLKSDNWKRCYKLYRVAVEYDRYPVKIDPYFMGLWLGDGNWNNPIITNIDEEVIQYLKKYSEQLGMTLSSHYPKERCQYHRICETIPMNFGGHIGRKNSLKEDFKYYGLMFNKEKYIPREYLVNDRQTRLEILAGLIDSDGSLSCNSFDIVTKHEQLARDIQELSLSLGFWCSLSPCNKHCIYQEERREAEYFRLFISGETDQIPTRINRKKASPRLQIKDVRNTGFSIRSVGEGEYYGFAVDGNHKYLLDDFTVTHNTFLAVWQAMLELLSPETKIRRIVVVRPVIGNKFGESIGALPGNIAEKMLPYGSSVLDNLIAFIDRDAIVSMIEDGTIEFIPLTLLRGRNLNNAFVIVEEAQNIKLSGKGVYMIMSRLGAHSKMVFNGDLAQSDLGFEESALADAIRRLEDLPGVGIVELYDRQDIQRHPLLYEIMERFEETDGSPF